MAPLRTLEIAAARIAEGPQTGAEVVEALRQIRGKVERWRLLYLWEYLQFDAKAEPNRLIGADQNLNAALNGIARELRMDRLSPDELERAMLARDLPRGDARGINGS